MKTKLTKAAELLDGSADSIDSDNISEVKKLMKEMLEELGKCIDKLPPREKVILTYHYGLNGVREHTQCEIADILKISQPQVSRSIKKGIKILREMMCKCL